MASVNIGAVYTADPANIWTPKSAFMQTDPFAIVLNAQADSSVVQEGLLYDAVLQIVGPQQDATEFPWWTLVNGDVTLSPTRDVIWNNVQFQWTDFAFWVFWDSYYDAIADVGNAKEGVFYVQGTLNVQGSDLFAASDRFWFKVRE
jgi:hypothetical protein